jgi:hypothetical protein
VTPAPRLTRHASKRLQQRGIPPAAVDALLSYGAVEFDHQGGSIYYLDKRSRRRMEGALNESGPRQVKALRSIYAVVGPDGEVVTVGHRRRRIFSDRKGGTYAWQRRRRS